MVFRNHSRIKISKQRINWQYNMQDLKLYACMQAGWTLHVPRLPSMYMLNSNSTPVLLPTRPLYHLADVYSALPVSRSLHQKSSCSFQFRKLGVHVGHWNITRSTPTECALWKSIGKRQGQVFALTTSWASLSREVIHPKSNENFIGRLRCSVS